MIIKCKDIWLEVYWDEAPNGGISITEIKYKDTDVFWVYYHNNLISEVEDIVLEYLEKGNTNGDYFGYIDYMKEVKKEPAIDRYKDTIELMHKIVEPYNKR